MPVMVELGGRTEWIGLPRIDSAIPPQAFGQRFPWWQPCSICKRLPHIDSGPAGASFTTDNRDLVVADRIDFHPTDVLEDADGSLLIVDTGGWYDLCCPSSRVDQKTAGGGIYRLTPTTSSVVDRQLSHAIRLRRSSKRP
ncbi:MAG: hypothetical protein R3C56_05015 [Pirellulaceae bacterium]